LKWSIDTKASFASHYLAVSGPADFAQYKEWMKVLGIESQGFLAETSRLDSN
jgi:hypothetical protein